MQAGRHGVNRVRKEGTGEEGHSKGSEKGTGKKGRGGRKLWASGRKGGERSVKNALQVHRRHVLTPPPHTHTLPRHTHKHIKTLLPLPRPPLHVHSPLPLHTLAHADNTFTQQTHCAARRVLTLLLTSSVMQPRQVTHFCGFFRVIEGESA